jgi:hypothetical protein
MSNGQNATMNGPFAGWPVKKTEVHVVRRSLDAFNTPENLCDSGRRTRTIRPHANQVRAALDLANVKRGS